MRITQYFLYSGFMSTRHSHIERIKISPAHVLSLFLNNVLELAYSIPKMICYIQDFWVHIWQYNFRIGNAIKGLSFFFCLPFVLRYPDFLVQAAVSHARDWFRDTYSISYAHSLNFVPPPHPHPPFLTPNPTLGKELDTIFKTVFVKRFYSD